MTDWIKYAEREVFETYGERVDARARGKSLLKFGRFDALGTSVATVWQQGGNEVLATTNAIDKVSSSSADDEQIITIEGHTVTGTGTSSRFTFITQDVTLAGQAETALATPLARVSRAYIKVPTVAGGGFAGDFYVYEDDTVTGGVPQTADNIHMKILSGQTQSYKAATTFSDSEYAFVTRLIVSVNKKTSATVDFQLEVKAPGSVFRPRLRISAASTGSNTISVPFEPYLIVPKNSDIRVQGVSSSSATEVDASFHCVLAKVK